MLEKFFPPQIARKNFELLFPNSSMLQFDAGDTIITQGEESKELYVIVSGSVSITKLFGTAGVQLADLGPGGVFGEIALVSGSPRVASATATSDVKAYKLSTNDVQSLFEGNPPIASFLERLAEARLKAS